MNIQVGHDLYFLQRLKMLAVGEELRLRRDTHIESKCHIALFINKQKFL